MDDKQEENSTNERDSHAPIADATSSLYCSPFVNTASVPMIMTRKPAATTERATEEFSRTLPGKQQCSAGTTSVQQQHHVQLATRGELEHPSPPPPLRVMHRSRPLLNLHETEAANDGVNECCRDYLTTHNDNLLVVAAVGRQAVGKSRLLSDLAADIELRHPLINNNNNNNNNTDSRSDPVFKLATLENVLQCQHCTDSVDLYVTRGHRVILLDTRPLLSPSVLEQMADNMRSSNATISWSESELVSIRELSFIMSVSHILLVVQDCSVDPDIIRLLLTCEMIRPEVDGVRCRLPRLIFVHNRCSLTHLLPHNIAKIQRFYQRALRDSGYISDESNSKTEQNTADHGDKTVSVLLMPEKQHQQKPHPCIECESDSLLLFSSHSLNTRRMCDLYSALLRVQPPAFTSAELKMSERQWYEYVVKIWAIISRGSHLRELKRYLT